MEGFHNALEMVVKDNAELPGLETDKMIETILS